MAWSSEDGAHEGHVGMLFRDGALGSGWQGRTVLVDLDPDGRQLAVEGWEYRPEADVIGWIPACSCGWRGHAWTRSPEPWDTDLDHRIAYSRDSHIPETVEDGPIYDEWHRHVAPVDALTGLGALAAAHADAGRRLNEAVATARAGGASWATIGAAVGITRQSAHERWARRETHTP